MGNLYRVVIHNEENWNEVVKDLGIYSKANAEKLERELRDVNYAETVYGDYYEIYVYPVSYVTDVDKIIAECIREAEEEKEKKRKKEMEKIQKAKDGVTLLEKAKEVFAPFDLENHFTKEDFKGYAKELHNAILKANLNIYLFDGKYDYYPDGTIKEWDGRERFKYSAIHIPFDCGLFDGLIYNCGNYDIDEDIERLREFIDDNDEGDWSELEDEIIQGKHPYLTPWDI